MKTPVRRIGERWRSETFLSHFTNPSGRPDRTRWTRVPRPCAKARESLPLRGGWHVPLERSSLHCSTSTLGGGRPLPILPRPGERFHETLSFGDACSVMPAVARYYPNRHGAALVRGDQGRGDLRVLRSIRRHESRSTPMVCALFLSKQATTSHVAEVKTAAGFPTAVPVAQFPGIATSGMMGVRHCSFARSI